MDNGIHQAVSEYYTRKIEQHGATPQGVDWNSDTGQSLRFEQLCKVIQADQFSIADLGCGYGALFTHLRKHHHEFRYLGLDISTSMIDAARQYNANTAASFVQSQQVESPIDYIVASGIFNVKFDREHPEWLAYIVDTLEHMNSMSLKGFSFNCLTSYSDPERMRSDLYYADPCLFFDLCKKRFSKDVALLHDYGLYEFTIIVRKP